MMNISRKSWLVRYAYFHSYPTIGIVTLCDFFWQIVGTTILNLFIIGIIVGGLWLTYMVPGPVFAVIGIVVAAAVILAWMDGEDLMPHVVRVAWEGFKERYCPIIRIE